jgi:type I restriction enzyme R subunit
MAFNEDTRVKIPALLHLSRLGYNYISLKNTVWDIDTNIFTDIFKTSIQRINDDIDDEKVQRLLEDIKLELDFEDLGKAFYNRLIGTSGIKILDTQDFNNNSFHVVTELTYKNGDEEFRPDITLLINGMPLAFIEVKKPNNREGILDERNRIDRRFQNKKFKRFINISQLLVFTNNMEYDENDIEPIQGSFYSSTSYKKASFNYFREEELFNLDALLKPENDETENFVLKDNNLNTIKYSPEFLTNKDPRTPCNRVLTSLFQPERLKFLLKYGIAYIQEEGEIRKHIMRYPQIFATKAIENSFNNGVRKGIIWHTQGSGKTALAYYNVKHLTDYFHTKGIVPKFYFIVDRLDLMTQAMNEFTIRGLKAHSVDSKNEFVKDIRSQKAVQNVKGEPEITVVNIQKFSDDSHVTVSNDYNTNIQRIYFLDEVHRSYNPQGSFLANLITSDRNAILIGLTGTPLIASDRRSRDIFGDYIHKYYYNSSIKDGYTLRLIREGIETNYKILLEKTLKEIEILKGAGNKKLIYAHPKFVAPMLDYILDDLQKSRIRFGDNSIGAMVVCHSSEQAKEMFTQIEQIQTPVIHIEGEEIENLAADPNQGYAKKWKATIILHDIGTKDERKTDIKAFKKGDFDIVFVFNMLLTGFDSPRLKKLYMGRIVKEHNLLQTLTRVNRPYKNFRYGFVVDFADIRKEFDAANKAYFEELQEQLGDEMDKYSDLFKSKEEIIEELEAAQEILFHFNVENAEVFSKQISLIQDKKQLYILKKALETIRNLFNAIRMIGHYELLEKVDFRKFGQLLNEVTHHIDLLNLKEAVEGEPETTNLLNEALENVIFLFKKVSEEEMKLADELKDQLRKTREAMAGNFDKKDPEFITLYEELKRLFKKTNLDEVTQEEMKSNMLALRQIHDKITELNRKNNLLAEKYRSDKKYARLHKRLIEKGTLDKRESAIHSALIQVKERTDEKVLLNESVLNNDGYFEGLVRQIVMEEFKKIKLGENTNRLDLDTARYINANVVKEYINEFNGVA